MNRPEPWHPMPLWLCRWMMALILLATMACYPAHALEHIVERAWLEDHSGQMDWEQARTQAMHAFDVVLTLGYGNNTVWIRLRIDPARSQAPANETLYLRIRPNYLDEVVLYDPLQDPPERPPVGDRFPMAQQPIPSTVHVLALPAGSEPRDLWLRLRTTSTRLAYFEVLREADLRSSNNRIQMLGAMYLSLMLLFIVWGLIQATLKLDMLMVSFVLNQAIWLVLGACFLGYARLYATHLLSEAAVDRLTSLMGVLAAFSALLYSHFLLEHLAPKRWRRTVMSVLMTVFGAIILIQLLGAVALSLHITMYCVLFVPTVLLMLGLLSPERTRTQTENASGLSKSGIVVFLVLTLLSTFLAAAPGLGLVQGAELSLYVMLFYGLASGLLMLAMLHYRASNMIKRQATLTAQAQTQRERAEKERQDRQEREQLLQMLGQELNTPLATLRMLLANERVPPGLQRKLGASVMEMAQVVERTLQTDQVENGGLTLHWERCALPSLLDSACHELPDAERIERHTVNDSEPQATVLTDRYLLSVVLRNLLDNALKYSARGTPVQLTLNPPNAEGEWSLTVSNRPGQAGWPDPERVFQKYYRSPQASHRSGTGLGLYMVQGLARLLGGSLHYEPNDEWVRFRLSLRPLDTETTK